MYKLELGVFMYKYSTDDLSKVFNAYFSKRSRIHNRKTRNMANYNLAKNFKREQILHPQESKHPNLLFGTPYQKKKKLSLNVKILRKQLKNNIFST